MKVDGTIQIPVLSNSRLITIEESISKITEANYLGSIAFVVSGLATGLLATCGANLHNFYQHKYFSSLSAPATLSIFYVGSFFAFAVNAFCIFQIIDNDRNIANAKASFINSLENKKNSSHDVVEFYKKRFDQLSGRALIYSLPSLVQGASIGTLVFNCAATNIPPVLKTTEVTMSLIALSFISCFFSVSLMADLRKNTDTLLDKIQQRDTENTLLLA